MKTINTILMMSLLSASLSACSGFFDKDNTPPPTPLSNFKSEATVRPVWYTKTGSSIKGDYLKLVPATANNAIFTADKNGTVTATDKINGKSLWQTQTPIQITGGPGAGDHLVLVTGRDGNIVALNQQDGKILWTAKTSTEILAAPSIANGIVLVKAIDGNVAAYSSQDGRLLWNYQQTEPNLILRGGSAPQMSAHSAVIGFANGNLVRLSARDGGLLWQKTMATPEGSFAIQRMIDIDANPLLFENRVYGATYQGRISALDFSSGQEIWTHDISSYTGIAADNNRVYITDAKSHVWAFDANSGSVDWRQPQLESRNTTGPVVMGNYLVVGDLEGYLHWMSKEDGHFIARTKVNSSGIIATPVVNDGTLYVVTQDGHLAAYTLG